MPCEPLCKVTVSSFVMLTHAELPRCIAGHGAYVWQVKLAVLKYYRIDENGKITRLRRECPECGAGVFMASHFDRQYCGKCGLTFTFAKPGEEAK